MAPPRSTRLIGPVLIPAGGVQTTLYTVPAGKVALLKSVRLVTSSGAQSCALGIGGLTASKLVLRASLADNATYVDADTDPIVLAAGESLWANDGGLGTGRVCITVSGALLTA